MRTLLLCGGRGTRAYPYTREVPKPMLQVGGQPILRRVMEIYARQGSSEFVLATGYRGDVIADYARELPSEWSVTVVNTGEDTGTGERIARCLDRLGERFFATYADGLGNIDLHRLAHDHQQHGGATVTVVPLPSPYGTVVFDKNQRVTEFREKPPLPDHWINAGFFVFDADAYSAARGDDLERAVLPALAADRQLYVFRHAGFWKSMDTHKDMVELDQLVDEEGGPWLKLPVPESS